MNVGQKPPCHYTVINPNTGHEEHYRKIVVSIQEQDRAVLLGVFLGVLLSVMTMVFLGM